ncbi:MAG: DUF2797 domain-containing protein [Leptospiraceae bacterium]|nr:DUF2797 domain-containing protein [Leptospiraceae bacterium]MCP5511740.1 DUF2797 domain-containing protein [Leptospiraceae bacterium]
MIEGYLRMLSHSGLDPVQYQFVLATYTSKSNKNGVEGELQKFELNSVLGKKIRIEFSGEIRCTDCGAITKKSFNSGSCYKCFLSLASNDICIVKPELCHFHSGTCREPDWGKQNCFKKHKVYLANTSGLKVGITKEGPITKRWVDQGAVQGLALFEVDSRLNSGKIEIEFAKFIADKTSWQKMLWNQPEELDLEKFKKEIFEKVNLEKFDFKIKELKNESPLKINYPILKPAEKKISYNPLKMNTIEDELTGIKGQYLIFKNGVLNCRTYSGYHCKFNLDSIAPNGI